MNSVGKGVIKKDAMALVTGQPVYCDDLAPKDCLVVKLLRSPHAYAKLEVLILPLRKEFLELKRYIRMRMFQLLVLLLQDNLILNQVHMIVES